MSTRSRTPTCRPIKRIDLIARGLLVHQGHVLVCVSEHGHAYLPGGHVEPGECAAGALRRELLEEAGLEVKVGALVYAEEAGYVPTRTAGAGGEGGRGGKAGKGSKLPRARHQVKLVFEVEPAGAWRKVFHVKRGAKAAGLPMVTSLEEGIGFGWRPLASARIVPATMNAWLAQRAKSGAGGPVVWRSWGLGE